MNGPRPLVSVVIPHHDRRDALVLCLRALAAQTYAPMEIIVVDDHSTDDSVAVAREAGVHVLRTRSRSGQSAARNLGAERAGGEILFFLDSDIALDPDGIENAVSMLRADPRLGAVSGILHPRSLLSQSLAAQYRALQMYHWWMPAGRPTRELHAALLAVPTVVYDDIGGFDPRLRDTEAADYRSRLVRRYGVQLTDRIRGCHDHDHTLRLVLRKVFRRAVASAREWRRGELPGDSRSRAVAGVLVLLGTVALPLPLLVGAAGAAVTPALVGVAVALDGATYRHVFAERGRLFGGYFLGVHLLVTLVGTVGMGVGVLSRLLPQRRTAVPAAGTRRVGPSRSAGA